MPPVGWRLLHLLVMATLAVTQPLLSALGDNPTFFVAHTASPGQMVAFVIIISLVPAGVLGALMLAANAVSREAGDRVFGASMAVLTFVFVLQVVDVIPGPAVAVVIVAAAISSGLMVLYTTRRQVRSAVSVLGVFPLAVVALFLFRSPAASIVFPDDVEAVALDDLLGADFAAESLAVDRPKQPSPDPTSLPPAHPADAEDNVTPVSSTTSGDAPVDSPAPISTPTEPTTTVPEAEPEARPEAAGQPTSMADRLRARFPPIYILVLDELPWTSLLDESGRIDAVRYPNFARLGATAHVFSNATTVAFTTEQAVPALLTGTLQARPAPVYSLYPDNVFTLLGGVYDVSASDPLVDLCPPSVCNGAPPAQVLELIAADEATRASQTTAAANSPTATTTTSPPATTTTAAANTSPAVTTSPAATTTSPAATASPPTTTRVATTTTTAPAPTTSRTAEPAGSTTESRRGGSLPLLLKDAAIVFAHLAAPEGVDFGLPSIGATWGSFVREPVGPDLASAVPGSGVATTLETSDSQTTATTTTIVTETDSSPTTASAATTTATATTAAETTTTATTTATAETTTTATTIAAATPTTQPPVDPVDVLATGSASEAAADPVDPEHLARERTALLDSLITSDTRVADLRSEIAAMTSSELPSLHYLHTLLPHVPWRFRPDGSSYADIDLPGYFSEWDNDPTKARFGQQRHLLQLGLVDRLLGEYLDRLEVIGDFDRAIVIVTADHGISFVPGERSRGIGDANAAGIANVPLLYKEPGQRAGTVQSQPVELIDIVPTLAAQLALDPPWTFDGRDMFAADPTRDRRVHGPYGNVDIPAHLEAAIEALAGAMHEVFGDGASGSLYALDGSHGLIGTLAGDRTTRGSQHCWTLERPAATPEASGVIGYVYGRVDAPAGAGIAVALSVDGVVMGTARSYQDGAVERIYAIGEPAFWGTVDPLVELHEIVEGRLAAMRRC